MTITEGQRVLLKNGTCLIVQNVDMGVFTGRVTPHQEPSVFEEKDIVGVVEFVQHSSQHIQDMIDREKKKVRQRFSVVGDDYLPSFIISFTSSKIRDSEELFSSLSHAFVQWTIHSYSGNEFYTELDRQVALGDIVDIDISSDLVLKAKLSDQDIYDFRTEGILEVLEGDDVLFDSSDIKEAEAAHNVSE